MSALVHSTLDLPLDATSPAAELRLAKLQATVGHLHERGARVTVFGECAGGRPELSELVRAMHAEPAWPAGPTGSVETPAFLDDLIGRHDVFVNDSFQWSYLGLPSLLAPSSRLPSCAGRELEHNLRIASELLVDPPRPFTAVLGGQDPVLRLHGLKGMILRADNILVGGAMSVPLLKAVGRCPPRDTSPGILDECRAVVGLGDRVQHRLHLPRDLMVRTPDGGQAVIEPSAVTEGEVVDIGPRTTTDFAEVIRGSSTVLWTGTVGEMKGNVSTAGTQKLAEALPVGRAYVVVGGDLLTVVLRGLGILTPEVEIVTATNSLLELLKAGDLPALTPLRS
jgi:phosphoglycerate kinase